MENKIQDCVKFYLLANRLKDKLRAGFVTWNIDRERVESVAEHIFGTCILAIAIDSQFNMKVNLEKVIKMLVMHETEEIIIKDFTPFDNITIEQKRILGRKAVLEILESLIKKNEYLKLIDEFEQQKTKESIFAKECGKLEADIQCKIYCDEKSLDVNNPLNAKLLKDTRIQELMNKGEKTIADFFIENDRPVFVDKEFNNIADYIKNNNLKNFES